MKAPLKYIGITKSFTKSHHGIDFGWWANHKNQYVYACDDGLVIYNRKQITGGYVIHIRHDNGTVSEYGHLLKDSQLVKEGMKVKKGEKIARMGKSGLCTGEHLHFGLYKGKKINYNDNSKWLNPLKYINVYNDQTISKSNANDIKHTKTAYNIPSEPLLIHYATKTGKIVGGINNGEECETYGLNPDNWNIVDNLRDYICSNRYLK